MICLWILIILWVIYFVFKPLVEQRYLKYRYGGKVQTFFYPLLGVFKFMRDGFVNHKDIIYYKRNTLYKNPETKVIVANIMNVNLFQVTCPGLAKQIFQNPNYYKKRDTDLFRDILSEKGLVFTDGPLWKKQRTLLSQHFTYQALVSRIDTIKDVTFEIFSKLQFSQRIRIIEECGKVACEVIVRSFFSQNFLELRINGNCVSTEMQEIGTKLLQISYGNLRHQIRSSFGFYLSTMPRVLMTTDERNLLKRINTFREIIIELIDQRITNYNSFLQQGNKDFLQVMLDEFMIDPKLQTKDRKEEIIHQFITFLFAGTDTTSHFAGLSCYALALHPDIQERLRVILRESGNSFEKVLFQQLTIQLKCNSNTLASCKYLTAFLNECLRLYSPSDGLIPRIAKFTHQLGEFTIRKGSYVDIALQPMMTNPKYYKNHLKFDIDRWMGDELDSTQVAFIPFSGGPRNCIGQHMALLETKIMLIYLLENYEIVIDGETNLKMTYGFLYQPQDDRLIKLKKLNYKQE